MRLHQLLSFASTCMYVWGAIFRPDHRNEKWSPCEGHFYKGWAHVLLLLKKASADFCCRCHEEKCVSIASFPTLKFVPVFWAYQIGHLGVSDLSEQDLLKNIATWFISPTVIGDLLRGKMHALPLRVTSKPSSSTTHVLSGVYHLNEKHMDKLGNWQSAGYIRWITYHHTDNKGFTFEGALVQNSQDRCRWKWMKLKQLIAILSGVFMAKPMQNLFDHRNMGHFDFKGLDEIPDGFEIWEYLDAVMPCVKKMQVKKAEQNTTTSKTPSTSDRMAGICSVLIHRTSSGLKRCLERVMLEKEEYTTSLSFLHSSVSGKPHNDRSEYWTRSPLQ
ncbi:uncharacterized protein [Danio rerio]|uniref:Uncharacterized protein n=1 Tax=Danio rerio TaxID=7955 RepID=A0AC58IAF6_DANRE